jgi:hypothetical protein
MKRFSRRIKENQYSADKLICLGENPPWKIPAEPRELEKHSESHDSAPEDQPCSGAGCDLDHPI